MKYQTHPKSIELLLDDAMISIDSRPLDREAETNHDSTGGEKPQREGPLF